MGLKGYLLSLAVIACAGCQLIAQTGNARRVTAVRHWITGNTIRIAIEVSGDFEYQERRLHAPERVYFDIANAKPEIDSRQVYAKEFEGEPVRRIRIAETSPSVTRVVLDLVEPVQISASKLINPARLVVELTYRTGKPASSTPVPAAPASAAPPDVGDRHAPALPEPKSPVESAPGPSRSAAGWHLSLSSAAASPGTAATVVMSLTSPRGQEPLALEWELSYPAPQVGIEDGDIKSGSAAESSGKSLTCVGQPKDAGTYLYRCILAGGAAPIPDGQVALVTLHVRQTAQTGVVTLRLDDVLGVSPDQESAPIEPTQSEITIQK